MIAAYASRSNAFAVRRQQQQCHRSSSWRSFWSMHQHVVMVARRHCHDEQRLLTTRTTATTTTTPCSLFHGLSHNDASAFFQDRSLSLSACTSIISDLAYLHLHRPSVLLSPSLWNGPSARLFHTTSVIQDMKKKNRENSRNRPRRQGGSGADGGADGSRSGDTKNASNKVDFDFYNRQTSLKKQQQIQQRPPQNKQLASKNKWTSNSSKNNKTIQTSRKPQQQLQQHVRDNDSTVRHRRRPQEEDKQQLRGQRRPRDLSSPRQQRRQEQRQQQLPQQETSVQLAHPTRPSRLSSGDTNSANNNVDFDVYSRQTSLRKQHQQRQQQQEQQHSSLPVRMRQRPAQDKQRASSNKWTNNSIDKNNENIGRRGSGDLKFERFDSREGNKTSRNPQQQRQQHVRDNDSTVRHRRRPQVEDEQQLRGQRRSRDLSSPRQQRRQEQRQQQLPPFQQPLQISPSAVFMDNDDEYESNNKFTDRTSINKERRSHSNEIHSRHDAVRRPEDPNRRQQEMSVQILAQPTTPHHHDQQRHSVFPPRTLDIFVSCLPGLESVLGNELTSLGIPHKLVKNGANLILSSADNNEDDSSYSKSVLLDCCLYLGSASQVLIRCGRPFSARALGELQRKVALMPWQDMLLVERNQQQHQQQQHQHQQQPASNGNRHHDNDDDDHHHDKDTTSLLENVHVKVTASKSRLMHTTAIRDRVLEGIHAALSKKRTNGGNDDKDTTLSLTRIATAAPVHLVVRVAHDRALISIDATGGVPLHQRGYRLETGKAPLREDLAYAMLYSAGWTPPPPRPPPITMRSGSGSGSKHSSTSIENGTCKNPYQSLLDPLCGSGTLPIEAASMIAGLPPGRLRPAPLHGTMLYDPKAWKELVVKALKQSKTYHQVQIKKNMISIAASDRNEGVIEIVKSNAKRAGVLDMLDIRHAALSVHPWLQNDDNDAGNNLASRAPHGDITNGAVETSPTAVALTADKSLLIATNLPFGRRLSGGPRQRSRTQQFLPLYQTLAARINGLLSSRRHTPNIDKDDHEEHDDEINNPPVSKQSVLLAAMCLTNDPHLLHRSGCQLAPFQSKLSMSHGGIFVSAMFASNQESPIIATGEYDSADAVLQSSALLTAIVEPQELYDPIASIAHDGILEKQE